MVFSLCYVALRWTLQLAVLRVRSNDLKDLEIVVLMAVDVDPGAASFQHGAPRPLFDSVLSVPIHPPGGPYHPYAVSRDGQRFLIQRSTLADTIAAGEPVVVMSNWMAALKK